MSFVTIAATILTPIILYTQIYFCFGRILSTMEYFSMGSLFFFCYSQCDMDTLCIVLIGRGKLRPLFTLILFFIFRTIERLNDE